MFFGSRQMDNRVMVMTEAQHVPVLLQEVLQFLSPAPARSYIDCTAGAGGHSRALLAASEPDGRLLAIDTDAGAVNRVRAALHASGERVTVVQGNFRNLLGIATSAGWRQADGILLDLGFSSIQLESEGRGLSFQRDEPLDMRLDPNEVVPTAADLLHDLPEEDIAELLYRYGDEPASRRIARAIVRERGEKPIVRTSELRALIHRVVGGRYGQRIDPATRSFQALRISVNRELDALEAVLPQALDLLVNGGRLAVISFHSLEDRIVKQYFARESHHCICPPALPVCQCGHIARVRLLTRTPVVATEAETMRNPRARSAKLRAVEKIAA